MFEDGIRRKNNFDSAFPRQRKFVEEIERCGAEELLPINVSGEVELIARTSYRLGHAEQYAAIMGDQAHKSDRKAADLTETLSSVRRERDDYKSRNEGLWDKISVLEKETEAQSVVINKLKAKLNPKKKLAKKGKK